MDAETFIRNQVLAILREDAKDKKDTKPAPKDTKPSGKRMGRSAQKGKKSAAIKNISAKAVNTPGAVFGELGIDKGSIAGKSNQEKAKKVVDSAMNNPEFSQAFDTKVSLLGSDSEGWTVLVKVRLVEIEEEGKDRPIIPTGRAARYLGALMTAAKNLGVVDFNPDDPQSAKHDPGGQNVYINLPM